MLVADFFYAHNSLSFLSGMNFLVGYTTNLYLQEVNLLKKERVALVYY